MSTLRVTTLQNTSGVEVYTCKAWVNFNGTGTVAIRGSGNVSSITDNGAGNYVVNFTSAMPNANYAVTTSVGNGVDAEYLSQICSNLRTTSTVQISTGFATSSAEGQIDRIDICVAIFR